MKHEFSKLALEIINTELGKNEIGIIEIPSHKLVLYIIKRISREMADDENFLIDFVNKFNKNCENPVMLAIKRDYSSMLEILLPYAQLDTSIFMVKLNEMNKYKHLFNH